jgi:hypothetical protein
MKYGKSENRFVAAADRHESVAVNVPPTNAPTGNNIALHTELKDVKTADHYYYDAAAIALTAVDAARPEAVHAVAPRRSGTVPRVVFIVPQRLRLRPRPGG